MFWFVLIAVFALQVAGYALWRSYANSATRLQADSDTRATRRAAGLGRFIGGHDRLGE